MLLIKVTDVTTSNTVVLVHEIKNNGPVEEHHIRIHELRGPVEGKPLAHYAISRQQAEELKKHL